MGQRDKQLARTHILWFRLRIGKQKIGLPRQHSVPGFALLFCFPTMSQSPLNILPVSDTEPDIAPDDTISFTVTH